MARKQAVSTEFEIPVDPVMGTRGDAGPPGKPKRARTRAVQPARNLDRWLRLASQWMAALGCGAVFIVAVYQLDQFLATSPRFRLPGSAETMNNPYFRIEGMRYASRERIAHVFDVDFGRSIYLMPLAERRAQLLRIDWIQGASILRVWPNRIVVSIVERKPVAFVPLPELALIDAWGVILTQPEKASFPLPVLTGIDRAQPPALRRERVQMMLELLKQVGQAASQISEIDVSDHRDLQVTLAGGAHAYRLHLGNHNFETRLRNFFAHFDELTKGRPSFTVFDLRLDDRITAMEAASNVK